MRILEEALTFDDVLLVPAYSEVLPREVSLASKLTREIRVNLPVVSAAMDTVTEARLAITIAQEGGIGIIHKNMSIESQARQVDRVKKFESGVISDPITRATGHDHPPGDRAHPRQEHLRRAGGARHAKWWASSRTAICASRPSSMPRSPRS